MKKQSHDLFAEHYRRQKITQFTKALDSLSGLVDWAALTKVVTERTGREASQPKGGRASYLTEALVKIIVLQQLYGNLSDEDTEHALLDRGSWQRFIGMPTPATYPMHAASGISRTNSPRQAAPVHFRSSPHLKSRTGAPCQTFWG